ncbi:MAG: purine-nucleoside phosphorylase [Gemmatimonadota bacterium]
MTESRAGIAEGTASQSVRTAADAIRRRLPVVAPRCAVILGSGLGGLVKRMSDRTSMSYDDIPGFASPGVEGHAGELVHGKLSGAEVLALSGRFHMYEGHSPQKSALPVRVVAALDVPILFVSNAAGGIRRTFTPGTLMIIADMINFTWRNPLRGPVVAGEERFPDMSEPFDRELRAQLRTAARELGIQLEEGVYAGLLGPAYETPAEVRMLERFGADAVGMSTVSEVLVARAIGMRVLGVSCITNLGAGLTHERISHADVLDSTQKSADAFERLVEGWIGRG